MTVGPWRRSSSGRRSGHDPALPFYLTLIGLRLLTFTVCGATGFQQLPFGPADAALAVAVMVARSEAFRGRFDRLVWPVRVFEAGAVLYFLVMAPIHLSYAVQCFARPFQDDALLALDRALGYDAVALMAYVTARPALTALCALAYQAIVPVSLAVFALGVACRREERIAERFATAFMIAVMLAAALGGLFPARGAVTLLDPATAAFATGATPDDLLTALRAGTLRGVAEGPLAGMISFPSMHVGVGVLTLHAVRRLAWARLVIAPLSLGLMATALTNGGHYLADALGGLAVAGLAIALTQALYGLAGSSSARAPRFA